MSLARTAAAFSPMQKILHWVVVVLLGLQFFVFDAMGRPFHQWMDGTGGYTTVVIVHIVVGVAILALTLWRLTLRVSRGAPAAPAEEPAVFVLLSKIGHGLIYLLLLLLPLSGLVGWFGKVGNAAGIHEVMTNLLLLIVIVHVAAVVVHQFYWKTNLIARMR